MAFRSVPRPSSPPGAKASTECPYHTPIQLSEVRRPSSDDNRPMTANGSQSSSAQNPDFSPFLEENGKPSGSFHTHVSEPSPPDLGARARPRKPKAGLRHTRHTLPVRHQPNDGTDYQSSAVSRRKTDNATANRQQGRTRPETHQNLIHPDKEQIRQRTNSSPNQQPSVRRPTWTGSFFPKNNTATIS
jgi:hypothetical protein